MDFDDQAELVRDYIVEATEFLDEFERLLLQLEQMLANQLDPEMIAPLLAILHTFKGNSGMMGFPSLQKYAHRLEDMFKAVQSGAAVFDAELAEFLLSTVAMLRETIVTISPEKPTDPGLHEELAALEQLIVEKMAGEATGNGQVASGPRGPGRHAARKTDVLKVDFKRLDHLLNLVGELVIYRTRLGRIEAQFKESLGDKGLCLDLSDASEQIGKATTELHEAIMKVRMLPLRHVLARFPRMVRDLARESGKEVAITFSGEETELDKTVIDEIGEPLLHLLRNAMDHGIEAPDEREAAGKPRQGSVMVRAYQESSHIIIEVEDDGRGIDREALEKKAEAAGLAYKIEAGHDLLDLIFMPGLSTAEKVTEVSGRGLGMDVVKKSLSKIGGAIELQSEAGLGTVFTIKLPLTLAIISALMVEVAGERYAVPLGSVVESVKIRAGEIHEVNGREVANVRDRILPLARLGDLFGTPSSADDNSRYVVIVQSSSGQIGLVVDSLIGQQEVVIKALDDYVGAGRGIAGATILGDGKVVLIVDVFSLVEKFKAMAAA